MQAARVESGGAEHENGGVDEKRESEGEGGIENGVTQGFATLFRFGAEGARLHEAGVQIEIMRHDGGTENADGDVKHFAIAENFRAGKKAVRGFEPKRA